MRHIDLDTWPRRGHYKVFSAWDYPLFNMCVDVNVTAFYPALKAQGISYTVAVMYLIARAANAIPEFRYRIHTTGVVEHEVVHPSTTILGKDNLFTFCSVRYCQDFAQFASRATEKIAYVKEHPTLENETDDDDWLYMTAIPWVTFTSFMHPINMHPLDSVPRFAWGKFYASGEALKMPLSVQGHHAVMDGLHMGQFYTEVQAFLSMPESFLG